MTGESNIAPQAAAILREVMHFSEAFALAASPKPEPGSQAEQEMYHHSEVGADGQPWSSKPARTPYDVAGGLMLFAAGQYVGSLAQLFTDEMALFGFQAAARSLVEVTARAWWILSPEIDIRERLARSFVEQWYSLQELAKVDIAAGRPKAENGARALKFRADAALLGIDEKRDKNGHLIGFGGLTRPASTTLIPKFLGSFGQAQGELWYRFVSGVTHSALFGVMNYVDTSQADTQTGLLKLAPRLPVIAVVNIGVLAVTAYLGAIERHATLYGRDSEQLHGMRMTAVAELFDLIRNLNEEAQAVPPSSPLWFVKY